MCENCILETIFINLPPVFYSQWLSSVNFSNTKTMLKWKVKRVDCWECFISEWIDWMLGVSKRTNILCCSAFLWFIVSLLYRKNNVFNFFPPFLLYIHVFVFLHMFSPPSRQCASVKKARPWEDVMWNYCELNSCLRHASTAWLNPYFFFPHLLGSLFTTFKQKWYCWHSGGLLSPDNNQAITNYRGNRRPFVFFLFFVFLFLVWYRILGIRVHIKPDHNCLLLTGELLVFHLKSDFTIRHGGGGEGWNRSLLGSIISYGLSGGMEGIHNKSTKNLPTFVCTANKTHARHKNSWIINHLNVRFCWLYVLYFLDFSLYY